MHFSDEGAPMKNLRGLMILALFVISSLLSAAIGVVQAQQPIRIIFLHHSTGQNLIDGGGVREGLTALGYLFFDHGYNGEGLRLADGVWSGESFNVPDDNTDPDGFAAIFSQPYHDPPDNAFSHLMQYDVILFKSCFPTSNIADDGQLMDYQNYYLSIRDTIDQYPQKLFVVVTPPPQVPNNSNPDEGRRARAFASWLTSSEFLEGHPNLVTFDFFNLLAGEDNFLKPSYRVDEWDAHPNDLANQQIGPILVDFLDSAIHAYFGEGRLPDYAAEPVVTEEVQEGSDPQQETDEAPVEPEPEENVGQVPEGGMITKDLEERTWQPDTDGLTSSIACTPDTGLTNSGVSSLLVNYFLGENGYASCANFFDAHQDWSDQDGVGFYLRSDRAGQAIILLVFSGPLENPVPFEVRFETSAASVNAWDRMEFTWDAFSKSEWYGEEGGDRINPGQIVSIVLSLETEAGTQGQFWVDSLSPLVSPLDISLQEEEEPVTAPEDENEGSGGICPFSTLALPLLTGAVWYLGRKKSRIKKIELG
jgi:hypothetical protein